MSLVLIFLKQHQRQNNAPNPNLNIKHPEFFWKTAAIP